MNPPKPKPNAERLMPSDLLSRHESLFKNYYKPLVVFATRLMRDQQNAEDVVQEVFAQVWKKKEDLEYSEGMVSYLFGAVKNACLNSARHLKVVKRFEQKNEYARSVIDNPYHYLLLHEIEKTVDDTLNKLPDKTRDVFIMSRFGQKKNKEIAELLNISVKTVEAHMTRVLAALRRNLRHYVSIVVLIIINGQ